MKSMSKTVVIIGAGGHSKVIVDIVIKSGDKVAGFLDDGLDIGTNVLGFPILGQIDEFEKYIENYFVVAIGNNYTRKIIAEMFPELNYYTAIHPTAVIGMDVEIGRGTVIMANAVINSSTMIGNHCIVNTAAIVEHDNIIHDYVHLSPNAVTGGAVNIGELTHIGIGASITNNINIIGECVIGAGSVVVNNIMEKATYVGVPARILKKEIQGWRRHENIISTSVF
jgi:sugar O-acyltransferase (sialic acid O-acetyltransferase NeuD family)